MATTLFGVANTNLQKIQPDILDFGVSDLAINYNSQKMMFFVESVRNGGSDIDIK